MREINLNLKLTGKSRRQVDWNSLEPPPPLLLIFLSTIHQRLGQLDLGCLISTCRKLQVNTKTGLFSTITSFLLWTRETQPWKLNYLKSSLRHEDSMVLTNLPLTTSNNQIGKSLPENQYSSKRLILEARIDVVFLAQCLRSESSEALRRFSWHWIRNWIPWK